MTKAILERLAAVSCTDLSDASDRVGVDIQCRGVMPLDASFSLVGRAWTLRYEPIGAVGGTVGDYIDDLGDGDVVMLDNQGRADATVWGDLLTTVAARRRVAGTVIDGICRDVDRARALNYPIFSRGNWMRTGKDRVRVAAIGEAVTIGGIRVAPGDWVRGDGDGVVAVPAARIGEVLEIAEQVNAAEARIREAIASGMSLREARAKMGYHSLQTKR